MSAAAWERSARSAAADPTPPASRSVSRTAVAWLEPAESAVWWIPSIVARGGRGGGDATVGQRRREVDGDAGLADVLVDEGVGEAGQRRPARLGGDLGLGPVADEVEDLLAQLGGSSGHPFTPTRTPRNRAGAAEWPVWAVCIGWPLPQLGTPQWIHSDPRV